MLTLLHYTEKKYSIRYKQHIVFMLVHQTYIHTARLYSKNG